MSVNSKAKGSVGERELKNFLNKYGFDTRRGVQYSGLTGQADVVGLEPIHIECKRVEKLNVENALKQSERDARENEIPVVMHRANRQEWKCTMRLDTFINIWSVLTDEQRNDIAIKINK